MFVLDGARELLRAERQQRFADAYIAPMLDEAPVLGFRTLMVALLAAAGAVVMVLVQTVGWAASGRWFGSQTAVTGSASLLAVAAAAAVLGYLVLRRATPAS